MPRPSIDYLNARRASKPASGGTNYARLHDKATDLAWLEMEQVRLANLNPFESLHEQVQSVFAEFRSWARNLPSVELAIELANEQKIPF